MKFVIDRSRWLRGEQDSALLRKDDGKMCCVGQMCLQLGISETEIAGTITRLAILFQIRDENIST